MGVKRTMMEDSFKTLAPNGTEPEVEDLNLIPSLSFACWVTLDQSHDLSGTQHLWNEKVGQKMSMGPSPTLTRLQQIY